MAKEKTTTATRTRNWTFLHYVDPTIPAGDIASMREDEKHLIEELERIGVPCALQLHYKDTTKEGKAKKPHWHIVFCYSSVKTMKQVDADVWHIAANDYVEPVRDTRATIRYLNHLDNPEKVQYDEPIICLNGLSIDKYLASTDKEKDAVKAMKELIAYIRLNDIMYYNDLLDMLENDNADELYKAAISRKLITPILAYLKAMDTQKTRQQRAALDALR